MAATTAPRPLRLSDASRRRPRCRLVFSFGSDVGARVARSAPTGMTSAYRLVVEPQAEPRSPEHPEHSDVQAPACAAPGRRQCPHAGTIVLAARGFVTALNRPRRRCSRPTSAACASYQRATAAAHFCANEKSRRSAPFLLVIRECNRARSAAGRRFEGTANKRRAYGLA
jgi:hypothetical protein